jgi:hypothetical protein
MRRDDVIARLKEAEPALRKTLLEDLPPLRASVDQELKRM